MASFIVNKLYLFALLIIILPINADFLDQETQVLSLVGDSTYTNSISVSQSGKYEIARFTIDPKFIKSDLYFKIIADSNKFRNNTLIINGWSKDELVVDRDIPMEVDSGKTLALNNYITSVDKDISVEYRIFLKLAEFKSSSYEQLTYQIKLSNTIISLMQLIYLGVNIIFFLGILFLLRTKIQQKIINFSWTESKWAKYTDYLARILIIFLIIDEFGLFLHEWGFDIIVFDVFRFFMELPGMGQLLLLASLVIIVPATYRITLILFSKLLENLENDGSSAGSRHNFKIYKSTFAFNLAVLVLSATILFWNVQCLIWGEYAISDMFFTISFWLALLVFVFPISLMILILKLINRISLTYSINPFLFNNNIKTSYIVFTVIFLSFSQTMITKVLVLLPLINKVRSWASYIIKRIPPKSTLTEYSLIPSNFYNLINNLNFYLLTTSAFILITIWQSSISPYPPLVSKYPFTSTIGLLYTFYILMYFVLLNSDRFIVVKSITWWCITLYILYFLPNVQPDLFFTSDENNSLLSSIHRVTGIWFLLFLHLAFVLILHLVTYALKLKHKFYLSDFSSFGDFRKYFFIAQYGNSLILLLIFQFLFILVFTIYEAKIAVIYDLFPDGALVMISLPLIFLFLPTLLQFTQNVLNEIKAYGGDDVIERIKLNNKFLRLYKPWNDNKLSIKGIIIFCFTLLFTVSVFYFTIIIVPKISFTTDFDLKWEQLISSENYDIYSVIEETENNLVLSGFNKVCSINKLNGDLNWVEHFDQPNISLVNDSLLWVGDKSKIELREINSGKTVYSKLLLNNIGTLEANNSNIHHSFIHASGFILIKENDKIFLLNESTGANNLTINKVNSPIPYVDGGPLVWRNYKNEIIFSEIDGNNFSNRIVNDVINDSLVHLYSSSSEVLIFTKDTLKLYSSSGEYLWSNFFSIDPKVSQYVDCVMFDNTVAVCNGRSLYIFNKKNGDLIRELKDLTYVFVAKVPRPFNNQLLSNSSGFFLLDQRGDDNRYKYFNQFGKEQFSFNFPGSGYAFASLSLLNDSVIAMGTLSLRKFSLHTGAMELEDFYQLLIKNKYPEFVNYNPSKLDPYASLISGNTMFWANRRGVFAAEHNLYKNK